MKRNVKTYWADDISVLERKWMLKMSSSFGTWDVYDEIKLKFHWRKLRWRFRMQLIWFASMQEYISWKK